METLEEKAAFIDKIHIFRRLDDNAIFTLAEHFKKVSYKAGDTIIERGEQSDFLYLIYQGRVRLNREGEGQKDVLFETGDYFGAEAILPKEIRHSKVTAEEDLILLRIDPIDFAELSKSIPYLKENLKDSVFGRRLVKKIHFDWVREDEVIYFLGRKHPILLWKAMIIPVILMMAIFGMFLLSSLSLAISPVIISAGLGAIVLIWGLWRWEDWRNDYYIVTNQRVVWIEKIIGIHDSRREAPLGEILSVGADVDFIGQFLKYGDVNVRTFVGNIHLHFVHHPYQVRHIIEELWKRAQFIGTRAEKAELKMAIRERLKNPDPVEIKEKVEPEKEETQDRWYSPKKEGNILKLRFEQGKTIVYRKHWFILFKQAGLPGVLSAILFSILAYQGVGILIRQLEIVILNNLILGGLFLASIFVFGWAVYQYVDWSNDTFQVTEDKIFDIDRKPLGSVESRSAPLENIHSTTYERRGILAYIFNYGTVYMEIGTADFAFEDVLNPAAVQQDIDNRRMARINKEKRNEQQKEKDRMIDWMVAYHQSAGDLNQISEENGEQEEWQIGDEDVYLE